jgi:hypothetical protein
MCRSNMSNLVESFEAAVIHTRLYVPKPLLILASLDKMYLWYMSVWVSGTWSLHVSAC